MAAELGLLSLTKLQKLAQSQQQHKDQLNPNSTSGSWMWNSNQATQDDEDSWEVRAFAEDTSNAMGTTWPPRSYTCTFCRREFRSAQALGGHMNVHRRDRARLHQAPAGSGSHHPTTTTTSSSPTLIIPTQELIKNGGLCFLYSLPNPNNGALFSHTTMNAHIDSSSPSTLLSISPYPQNNLLNPNYPSSVNPLSINTSICHSSNTEPSGSVDDDNNNSHEKEEAAMEELDLELRLGCRPSPS